jgi:hypothetical protein
MRSHGCPLNDALLKTICQSYYQTALRYVKIYSDDAAINELNYDRNLEEQTVRHFRDFIWTAWEQCQEQQDGAQIPSWNRVMFCLPEAGPRLVKAVHEDALAAG